jgi:Phage derived protein Gp49-like (DUF891)
VPEVHYFLDERGGDPVRAYFIKLLRAGERAPVDAFDRAIVQVEERGGAALGMPLVRLIDRDGRLWELRLGSHRVAFIEHGGIIVLLHAWRKRSRKLDIMASETAGRRASRWRARQGLS